uniref:hemiasterlin resistant protein 1-like isoform X2 n=1 Tax=Fragaria vesca subsp. vesca TaxID=101020 RepID=UPI0005C86BE9|nr:PREDICTED: hemiasterlin resistant protein 1-like isoform X2 [Fragaria vesca subsp. vesca]XP_011458394.1 PREDICTED: hemiasterlin resistant protein 1-like isoform X2 [Fragaria vesca subsp. vesca]
MSSFHSEGRSARPAPRRAPAPAPVRQAPAPAPAQSGSGGGIGSVIAEGMAFGAVDSLFGPRTIKHETVVSAAPAPTASSMGGSDACSVHSKAFQDCISNFGSDISKCQFYMDMLSDCKKNNSDMLSA